ncbi:hypothetical protein GMES_1952 [Paraglaciecola mesophila KMM 241]|uniref:Tyr recombinase domain-containing protein n=1 Tax=Paraglaciecola mesophila KMM 241 TaxID=1128912 RepID=K6Z5G5_9ALTE|nr:site-specific integrase [Paraglaciecola mesophila]GAC24248.1 hypothetical protein GMES_1952 [Paraglaciecola mesophila KMM 241]
MQTNKSKHIPSQITPDSNFDPAKLWWLESKSNADKWFFKPDNHSALSSFTVNWTPDLVTSSKSDFGRWRPWKEYAQKLVQVIIDSDSTDVKKTITLAGYAREIRSVCLWFCFTNRLHHIAEVKRIHIASYEEFIKESQLTINSVITKLHIVNLMWKLRDEVGCGLAFLPYYSGKLKPRAKKLGRQGGRTKTIRPRDFFKLLDKALHEVEYADQWLCKLERYIEIKELVGPSNCAYHYKKEFNESSLQLFKRIRIIYASAIVTILSLTAMRKHEANVLKYSDAVRTLENVNLEGTEHKTAHTETGKHTQRPLPEDGKKALKLIIELTKFVRKTASGLDKLLLRLPFQNCVSNDSIDCNTLSTAVLYRLFNEFAKDASINFALRPHMLRRAFAMIWTWRFEIGDLDYLSRFLYHNSHFFTEIYVDDPDVYDFLPEEMQRYTAKIFEQAFLGGNNIEGGIKSALSRYRRLIQQKVKVVEPEVISIFIDRMIEKFNYQVIPNADGYCFMSTVRGSRAKCSTDGENPDYTNRNEKTCSSCPNFGVDEGRVDYWKKRRDAHQVVLNNSEDQLMVDSARRGVQYAEHVISMFKEVH